MLVHGAACYRFIMAGFSFQEQRHTLQFVLAIVLVYYNACRADEEKNSDDNMDYPFYQTEGISTKIQIKSANGFRKLALLKRILKTAGSYQFVIRQGFQESYQGSFFFVIEI